MSSYVRIYSQLTCALSQQLCQGSSNPGILNLMSRTSLTHQLHSPGEFELLTSDHFDKQEIVEFSTREGRCRFEREGEEGGWRVGGRVESEREVGEWVEREGGKGGWRVGGEGGWRVGGE